MLKRTHLAGAALAVALACAIAPIATAAASARTAHQRVAPPATHVVRKSSGVVVTMGTAAFGQYLVVGSGPFKGDSLYAITSDSATSFGCTTVPFSFPGSGGAFPCTGPESPDNSEWPAFTTTAAPVAGPGVHQAMLHSVYRKGIGHQVTYNGHPLYLFDNQPGQISGEGWDEPSLPPWHGSWWLVNPNGSFQEWSQTLTAAKLADNATALSSIMIDGGGFYPFPVYEFSVDTPTTSYCGAACSRVFEPVLTTGTPGTEGTDVTGAISAITRTDGTTQVTYDGHPLYLYSAEGVARVQGRGPVATGSGAGKTVGAGTFSLVTP